MQKLIAFLVRRASSLALLAASSAFAQAPPPIPVIADTDRVQSFSISSSTAQVAVNFPVFGDCTDLKVQFNNITQPLSGGLWNCASLSGFALNTLPLPITDMVVNLTPPLTSGTLQIIGSWHPRNLTVPTASGINRREYEQTFSTVVAGLREADYNIGVLLAGGGGAGGGTPSGPAGGVLAGSYPNPGMATGAAATNVGTLGGDLNGSTLPNPTISSGAVTSSKMASGAAAGNLGSFSGDATGTPPAVTLATVNSNTGQFGDATHVPQVTFDAKGRATAVTNVPIAGVTPSIAAVGGRLTLQSHTPVMTSTQSGKTTIFYDPYTSPNIPYYTGTTDAIDMITGGEMSVVLESSGTGLETGSGVFDVWWWHNGGSPTLCIATNGSGGGWASDTGGSNTARGTGYSQLDKSTRAYPTNANALAHCYNGTTDFGSLGANMATHIGTIMTDSSAGQVSWTFGGAASGGTAASFGLWSQGAFRPSVRTSVVDNGASYTYAVNTIRAARASNTNRVTWVSGDTIEGATASYTTDSSCNDSAANTGFGMALDSTTTFGIARSVCRPSTNAITDQGYSVVGMVTPQIGVHFIQATENAGSATSETFDALGAATLAVQLNN